MRRAIVGLVSCGLLMISTAMAQVIAPGVTVELKLYGVPINEEPYFGFLPKTPAQIEADREFVEAIDRSGTGRDASADISIAQAWQAIGSGRFDIAARRLNQAWLLRPDRSEITHFFAIIVQERFNDSDRAIALFEAAARLSGPLPTLPADHASLLLAVGRPADAIPLFRQAVRESPDWAIVRFQLAVAYRQTNRLKEACETSSAVTGRDLEHVAGEVAQLRRELDC